MEKSSFTSIETNDGKDAIKVEFLRSYLENSSKIKPYESELRIAVGNGCNGDNAKYLTTTIGVNELLMLINELEEAYLIITGNSCECLASLKDT
jgi:hypothetical protein